MLQKVAFLFFFFFILIGIIAIEGHTLTGGVFDGAVPHLNKIFLARLIFVFFFVQIRGFGPTLHRHRMHAHTHARTFVKAGKKVRRSVCE